jgi:hypothetical protein
MMVLQYFMPAGKGGFVGGPALNFGTVSGQFLTFFAVLAKQFAGLGVDCADRGCVSLFSAARDVIERRTL